MLVFDREAGETIYVGEAEVRVLQCRRGRVRIGIEAPPDVSVDRGEIRLEKRRSGASCMIFREAPAGRFTSRDILGGVYIIAFGAGGTSALPGWTLSAPGGVRTFHGLLDEAVAQAYRIQGRRLKAAAESGGSSSAPTAPPPRPADRRTHEQDKAKG